MSTEKLFIAFGFDLVTAIEQYDHENLEENTFKNGGRILQKEFNTKAEKEAYLEGINDMNGWNEFLLIDDHEVEKFEELI